MLISSSAGSRDSNLTNHGILQARQLGNYLAEDRLRLTHIFTSPLQRALKTANAVKDAQPGRTSKQSKPVDVPLIEIPDGPAFNEVPWLVEQDFGFYEGKPFYARSNDSSKTGKEPHYDAHKDDPGFVDVESKDSLAVRCDLFLDEHLIPLLDSDHGSSEHSVAIVSHGILLSNLWRRILRRLPQNSVKIGPHVSAAKGQIILEHLGGWSNTGFLELSIRHTLLDFSSTRCGPAMHESIGEEESSLPSISLKFNDGSSPIMPTSDRTSTQVSSPSPDPRAQPIRTSLEGSSPTASRGLGSIVAAHTSGLNVSLLEGFVTTILTINGQDHLRGLKRTRGGIGSAGYDEGQKTISSFFKRAKKT